MIPACFSIGCLIAMIACAASQPTIEFVTDALRGTGVRLSVVSEAGASVYSVSSSAQKAEPGMDPQTIGAASLARRLQVPAWGD